MAAALLLSGVAGAQSRWSVGAEIAAATDKQNPDNGAGRLQAPELNSAYGGITVRYRFAKLFFAETGAYAKRYDNGIRFKGAEAWSASGNPAHLQVPLRIGARIPLGTQRLALEPVLGYTLGFQPDEGERSIQPSHVKTGEGLIAYDFETRHPSSGYNLFEGALSLDYRVWKRLHLAARAHYFAGTRKRMISTITYSVNGGAQQRETYSNDGGFYAVGLGARIAL